jgi:prevent-host-death family protein
MNGTQILSISDLRQNTAKAIASVSMTKNPTIIFQRSRPKAVLVDYDYYQSLEEAVLDLTDAKEAEKAKKEPKILLNSYIKKRWRKTSL